MRLARQIFTSLVAAAAITAVAGAQPVISSGEWRTVPKPEHDGDNYWDNESDDGKYCNIGYFAVGGFGSKKGCSNQNPDGFAGSGLGWDRTSSSYLSASGKKGYKTNVSSYFGAGYYDIEYLGNVAGADPMRQFGYRDLATGNTFLLSAGQTYTGLYFESGFEFFLQGYLPSGSTTYYQSSSLQFSVFANGANGVADQYLVGGEDNACLKKGSPKGCKEGGDWDYNDAFALVTLSSAPGTVVPEPSTYLLMATGLLGLAGFARRRRG